MCSVRCGCNVWPTHRPCSSITCFHGVLSRPAEVFDRRLENVIEIACNFVAEHRKHIRKTAVNRDTPRTCENLPPCSSTCVFAVLPAMHDPRSPDLGLTYLQTNNAFRAGETRVEEQLNNERAMHNLRCNASLVKCYGYMVRNRGCQKPSS